MSAKNSNSHLGLSLSLVFAVFLWGGNNTGTKFIVASWPPIWTGGSRFFLAGLLMLVLLRWTTLLGKRSGTLGPDLRKRLWWHGGLSLAIYIVAFNTALRFTSASHVALYLGTAPVWALLWEAPPRFDGSTLRRYGAAALALAGIVILFWPALQHSTGTWVGELLGLSASVLWTNYGRQCRALGAELSGAETSAHTMWRAGLLLLPFGLLEIGFKGIVWRNDVALVQLYCILAGGVTAFAIWSNALRRWPTSQVLLFNNLIPLSTTLWAHFWLREPITPNFWFAMLLVVTGVVLGQGSWRLLIPSRTAPPE